MKRLFTVVMLASLATAPAFATTYVRVEPDGTKTYSDRPIPGGQPVELQSAQTYSATSTPAATNRGLPAEQQLLNEMGDAFKYDSCTLKPNQDQTFMNPESVAVGVNLRPALRPGDVVDLKVDGASGGDAGAQSFVIKPVYRGTHTVTVTVRDRYGRVLCDASSAFHVHQPNLNSPARQAPPPPKKK